MRMKRNISWQYLLLWILFPAHEAQLSPFLLATVDDLYPGLTAFAPQNCRGMG